jgi:hypothetical protein
MTCAAMGLPPGTIVCTSTCTVLNMCGMGSMPMGGVNGLVGGAGGMSGGGGNGI